jgi:polyisoprenoid-binding protein YceI
MEPEAPFRTLRRHGRSFPSNIMQLRNLAVLALSLLATLAYAATHWVMQPKQSELTFTAVQAGAPFQGKFQNFDADIRFDANDLANSRFEVKIDLASVNTQDAERDDILASEDLFAVEKWPTATYVAEKFQHRGGAKFAATGKLTLRGVTRELPIEFSFETTNTGAWLKGSGTIKRLDFGVGQGEWKDTSVDGIANEVKVQYTLLLTKS